MFDKYAAKAQAEGKTTLNGIDVWRLYDTFGFPGDLTRIMAEERGLTVDEDAFEKAKQESYEISKAGGKNKGKETVKLDVHDLGALEQNADVPKTNDDAKFCEQLEDRMFLHFTNACHSSLVLGNTTGKVKAIYQKSKFVKDSSELEAGSPFGLLLDQTNFYAESGGQENDTGSITIDGEADFEVTDVQVYNGYVLHIGQLKEGQLKVGDEVTCTYDEVSPFLRLLVSVLTPCRTDDDRCETITPLHISSTLLCGKCWVITLTRRAPSLLRQNCDSTLRTSLASAFRKCKRSRISPMNGSRGASRCTRRKLIWKLPGRFQVCELCKSVAMAKGEI